MLESMLADILTRVLGQYLKGIDRESLTFGAWSGLIELRTVQLRPEALAVLFETLGIALPVTVESGFIGLLRLVVPWKSLGSSPVQIYMHDVTIVARPVSGDGSNQSQLAIRDRRIKLAKLNTDDAVREAAWNVVNEKNDSNQTSWSSWLVSDELRTTIINNIQIHLCDIIVRFEDPYSNPQSPYVVSMQCESLKVISTDAKWNEAFVADAEHQKNTRKLLEIKGFHVDWAPFVPTTSTTSLSSSSSSTTAAALSTSKIPFESPEMLRKYVSSSRLDNTSNAPANAPRSLIHRVDGSMRLRLCSIGPVISDVDFRLQQPRADLDIIFPGIVVDLNDRQYACIMQTSLYFARIATRGFRPSTPKSRWKWAVDQLLPGCTTRFARALRFTPDGLVATRKQRDSYIVYRTSLLKARRMRVEEPKQINSELETMESLIDFYEILAYRDAVDAQIEKDGHLWIPKSDQTKPEYPEQNSPAGGTTISSFWSMLGYNEDSSSSSTTNNKQSDATKNRAVKTPATPAIVSTTSDTPSSSLATISSDSRSRTTLILRAAFLLENATLRMSEGGYPSIPKPKVKLNLQNFRIGVLYSSSKDLIVEGVLGCIEAWDLQLNTRMVYSRFRLDSDSVGEKDASSEECYPRDVSEAIESIRRGSNPAKDLLEDERSDSKSNEDFLDDVESELTNDDIKSSLLTSSATSTSVYGDMMDTNVCNRPSMRSRQDDNSGNETPSRPTHRITEEEFLGSSKYSGSQKYVVAFRYSQLDNEFGSSQKQKQQEQQQNQQPATLDVSVATLEAIVDGPKGAFVWGLKFWQPKGMVQDPIVQFLGAAAGARIAQMRMELEQALLTDSVPMQVNAVILAPRFIIPSASEMSSCVVVNMGTLGICTSDSSPHIPRQTQTDELKHLRYSNYVLTLNDLGMYYSPNLSAAVSQNFRLKNKQDGDVPQQPLVKTRVGIMDSSFIPVDMTDVERIIRPFSLQFVLQSLRDSKVVQVAHGDKTTGERSQAEGIAKVRLRGNIPQLSLIFTQRALQHILSMARNWSEGLRSSGDITQDPQPNSSLDLSQLQPTSGIITQTSTPASTGETLEQSSSQSEPNHPTLAAYSVKVVLQTVSVELRESVESKLVTAVASGLSMNIVKRAKTKLLADLLLRSWSVTDGSRGSTAAFRRLLYSGTASTTEGVSPPRHSAGSKEKQPSSSSTRDENFVNIRFALDLATFDQEISFRFLSLHMNCVRETYLRLLSFFERVRRHVRLNKQTSSSSVSITAAPIAYERASGFAATAENHNLHSTETSAFIGKKTSVTSKFDGFSLQLVASEGVVAIFEMKNSEINFLRSTDGSRKAWGSFGSFSIRDLTAPLQEHVSVLSYDRLTSTISSGTTGRPKRNDEHQLDGWECLFPTSVGNPYQMKACFEGIRMLFLYRFSEVLRDYILAFMKRARPVLSSITEEIKIESPQSEHIASQFESTSSSAFKVLISIDVRQLALRVPRHSTCLSEALTFQVGSVHIDNIREKETMAYYARFDGMQGAVEYLLNSEEQSDSSTSVSSTFLTDCATEILIQPQQFIDPSSEVSSGAITKVASLNFDGPLRLNFSEAQYSVLYFVVTENFAETVSSDVVATTSLNDGIVVEDLSSSDPAVILLPNTAIIPSRSTDINPDEFPADPNNGLQKISHTSKVDVNIPVLCMEVSRGWNVDDEFCKILGVYLTNVVLNVSLSIPSKRVIEARGTLHSITDLRQESEPPKRNMVVHLLPQDDESSDELEESSLENVSVTYEKEGTNRPSIVVSLDKLQFEMVPELLRDLSYLAIPGWPFLKTSDFGPDFQYIGRTINLALNNSQILLLSESSVSDRRALVLTGEFELKMDFKRMTGAKSILLQSKQLEISAVNEIPPLKEASVEFEYGLKNVYALPFEKTQSPLIYPTDSEIEIIGPGVDDAGRRIHISVDAALCMLCTSEIPVLKGILKRLSSLKPSYLSQRDWSLPNNGPLSRSGRVLSPKEKQKLKAQESLKLSVDIPVSRYLVTDDSAGRFIPIVEVRLTSLAVQAHGGSMVQVDGQFSMDLFNPKKGSWEPAVEPWSVSASSSKGQSGARAFVVRSDERLNLNIAPTTITAVKTFAKVLSTVSAKKLQREDPPNLSRRNSRREELRNHSAVNRPSVAAFLIRNDLGIPITMCLPGKSKWTSIPHNSEVEVGAQSEALVSSISEKDGRSRDNALRCSISIPSFMPQNLSAAEAGKHTVTFHPRFDPTCSQQNVTSFEEKAMAMEVIWDVELRNGVPLCTVRSAFRIVNNTKSKMDVVVLPSSSHMKKEPIGGFENMVTLEPGNSFPVPVHDLDGVVHLRPVMSSPQYDFVSTKRPYQWSAALPKFRWLLTMAEERMLSDNQTASSSSRRVRANVPLIECKPFQENEQSFFFKLIPSTCQPKDIGSGISWLDISIRAPIVLSNKLPGTLSYRVHRSERPSSSSASLLLTENETQLAAGVVDALDDIHLFVSDESLNTCFLSMAFDNGTGSSPGPEKSPQGRTPSDFGRMFCLGDVEHGKVKAIYPSPEESEDLRGQKRKHFRANIKTHGDGISNFVFYAGFWVRNRSDTAVEICSRSSKYSTGTIAFYLREKPPHLQPDEYVCCEGPFLSIRLPSNRDSGFEPNWWTSPTALDDIEKPVSISLPGRSLELEVRPSIGLECTTHVVTIRNSSWIINSTPSTLQWCQQAALDAHGNCPTRLLHSLGPRQVQGLHWNSKSSTKAIHLRLADENAHSEWIWSPPVPLDIGHSRELPAKMYRPRTHDQYIARVASKQIAGDSRALVVYEEDRQNPPYRIINNCTDRAIAFSQVGSHERPWLVRGGKSTRYSWDDPLARPKHRLLSVRIIEKEDLLGRSPNSSDGGQRSRSWHAPPAELNIDEVGDRVMVLGDPFDPPVVFNVSVDGATKVITLFDEGSVRNDASSSGTGQASSSSIHSKSESTGQKDGVPIVEWDDIHYNIGLSRPSKDRQSSDYAKKNGEVKTKPISTGLSFTGTDAAVFLDSVGISIIDGQPEELLYCLSSGILLNYEASRNEQNILLTVDGFQIDNQIAKTPYPVLLWTKSVNAKPDNSEMYSVQDAGGNALTVEFRRDMSMDDILMVKSFKGQIQPFNVSIEEGLLAKLIQFCNESLVGDKSKIVETLREIDDEGAIFTELIPGVSQTKVRRKEGNNPSSKRIYVHQFKIGAAGIRLTSSGSGAALAKAAGLNASARAILGLILNVENCNFDFPALSVDNVFTSLHHFGILVRTYYIQQLDNQRIKLLTSNSLVGNPAALFDAVGTGARDFLTEPGRAKGSVDFLASVGRGSKSLFTHTVGGFVESVSSIPRAVSTGLERAVGDNEYLAERERIRGSALGGGHRGNTRNPAQGLATGAMSLAHGISSGVTGLIREPIQGAKQGGAGGLLKGIGKAFIGGVAKPVAGAMDLVAEPAAGISRQITDVGSSNNVAAPNRPPRAFHGVSQKIERYDRWYSTGVWLMKAVCMSSGTNVRGPLVDWIELSDRPDRRKQDADLWVWFVVQRFSRYMPGAKKNLRSDMRQHSRVQSGVIGVGGDVGDDMSDFRPEKTRVALLTEEQIMIVTLDCKLITVLPLWDDTDYELVADGKELIVRATVLRSDAIIDGNASLLQTSNSTLLQGAQSLIQAPWDVASSAKRRKPAAGQSMIERIVCGSPEACKDLQKAVGKVVDEKYAVREQRRRMGWTSNDPMISGEELSMASQWRGGEDEQEMRTPRYSGAGTGRQYYSDQSRDRWISSGTATTSMRAVEELEGEEMMNDASERNTATLKLAIQRLSIVPHRRQGSGKVVRVILANEIEGGASELRLKEGSLERGQWVIEAPVIIEHFNAQVMEIDVVDNNNNKNNSNNGDNGGIDGSVAYTIFDINTEDDDACHNNTELGQVCIEFARSKNAAGSFTTKASRGYCVTYDGTSGGGQGTYVFRVKRADSDDVNSGTTGIVGDQNSNVDGTVAGSSRDDARGAGGASGMDNEIGTGEGASNDEKLLQQLMDIGFKFEDAVEALASANGDLVKAVDLLMSK